MRLCGLVRPRAAAASRRPLASAAARGGAAGAGPARRSRWGEAAALGAVTALAVAGYAYAEYRCARVRARPASRGRPGRSRERGPPQEAARAGRRVERRRARRGAPGGG